MIDWSAPLEAVHTDGRVVPVSLGRGPDSENNYRLSAPLEPFRNQALWFNADGSQQFELSDELGGRRPWSIRNVQQPTVRTSDEALRRMEALVERMDFDGDAADQFADDWVREAIAIQALRTPIDPRLEPVARSLVANGFSEPVARLYARDVLKALDA